MCNLAPVSTADCSYVVLSTGLLSTLNKSLHHRHLSVCAQESQDHLIQTNLPGIFVRYKKDISYANVMDEIRFQEYSPNDKKKMYKPKRAFMIIKRFWKVTF